MKSAFLFIAVAVAAWTPGVAQPKLSIDKMTVDLGTLYNGSTKTGTITLKNIGTEPLKILRVQPSCGCTTVRQPKSELQPNESDQVEVSFNATLYHGPVEKYVNIETNDPLSQYVSVKLIADVKEDLSPTSGSYSVWMGSTKVGEKTQQRLAFVNRTNRAIVIKQITCSAQNFSAAADKQTVSPSDTVTVLVTTIPDKAGYNTANISIETDSKNQPNVELKIYSISQKRP